MRRLLRRLGLTLLVGFASIQGGCKPNKQKATQVKTLDNFAIGEKVRTNACSATAVARSSKEFINPLADDKDRIQFGDEVAETKRAALRKDISDTLSAVPAETQQMFIKLGGYINVTSKTSELCSKRFKKAGKNKTAAGLEGVTACFTYDTQGSKSRFRINIMPNDSDIKHSLVRVFGYMYAQFYSRIGESSDKTAGAKLEMKESESFRFANIKIRLAQNFLADMVESKTFNLETMDKIIGVGSAKIIRQNYAALNKISTDKKIKLGDAINKNFDTQSDSTKASSKSLDLLNGVSFIYLGENITLDQEQKDTRRRRFEDYVFAEAYDSFYCHPFGSFPTEDEVNKAIKGDMTDTERNNFFANTEDTKKVMDKFFHRSHDLFLAIDSDLTAIASALVGKPKEEAPNQQGFALTENSEAPAMSLSGEWLQQLLSIGFSPVGMGLLGQLFRPQPIAYQPGYQPNTSNQKNYQPSNQTAYQPSSQMGYQPTQVATNGGGFTGG